MKRVRARILIEGRLQNINFRYHTQQQAKTLGLKGFVRNLSDGRTEIEVQGNEEKVEQMLEWCQQEPHGSFIKRILFRYDETVDRYTDFTVR
jgi:acylphosphatase